MDWFQLAKDICLSGFAATAADGVSGTVEGHGGRDERLGHQASEYSSTAVRRLNGKPQSSQEEYRGSEYQASPAGSKSSATT